MAGRRHARGRGPGSYLIFFIIFITASISLVSGCSSFRTRDEKLLRQLGDSPVPAALSVERSAGFDLRVLRSAGGTEGQVLFLHGAPGSIDDSLPYFRDTELARRASLVAYDRPGYGFSEYGQPETSLEVQAAAARGLINPGAVVVGHSFGATVALRMAMDYPDDLAGVIILAGVSAAEHEKIWWFNRPLASPALNWLLNGAWRSSNAEKLSHLEELPLFDPLWQRIRTPVIIVHGTRDALVPYENAPYALERIGPEYGELITLEDENHFILWTRQELVTDLIFRLLDPAGP
jgi:pimeloyl-ACP methyl ester carboxylesterase